MDALLSEENDLGQMITFNRVAGFAITGNEDGAKHCIVQLAAGAIELGFSVSPQALTHCSMGPGPDYADTDHGKQYCKQLARSCAHNLYHTALALRDHPIPPE